MSGHGIGGPYLIDLKTNQLEGERTKWLVKTLVMKLLVLGRDIVRDPSIGVCKERTRSCESNVSV